MKKFILQKVLVAFAMILSAGFSIANAQTKSCWLKPDVRQAIYAEPLIDFATATAVNLETKKTYKAVLFKGLPVFNKLPAGKYTLTVSKKGYRTLVKQITLDCGKLDDDDRSQTEYILLRKIKKKGK